MPPEDCRLPEPLLLRGQAAERGERAGRPVQPHLLRDGLLLRGGGDGRLPLARRVLQPERRVRLGAEGRAVEVVQQRVRGAIRAESLQHARHRVPFLFVPVRGHPYPVQRAEVARRRLRVHVTRSSKS